MTHLVARGRFCENARWFTMHASRARSLNRLTGASRVSYTVLKPVIAADMALVPAGFHPQGWPYPCVDNCDLCQEAQLSLKRNKTFRFCMAFIRGSLSSGGFPYLLTVTYPSYAPRSEYVADFFDVQKRYQFKSAYINRETNRRFDSLVKCVQRWHETEMDADGEEQSVHGIDLRVLRSVDNSTHIPVRHKFDADGYPVLDADGEPVVLSPARTFHPLTAEVDGSMVTESGFRSHQLEQEAAWERDRLESESDPAMPVSSYLPLEQEAHEARSEHLRLLHHHSARVQVRKDIRAQVRFEIDADASRAAAAHFDRCSTEHRPHWSETGKIREALSVKRDDLLAAAEAAELRFEELWWTECFERGWLQAIYSTRNDDGDVIARHYMPDTAVTKGRNYTDFHVYPTRFHEESGEALNGLPTWEPVHEDTPDRRPTSNMAQAMFKRFHDRLYRLLGVKFSYYGVEEFGEEGANFHLHLLIHNPRGKSNMKEMQRSWAKLWHAVSGNVIWRAVVWDDGNPVSLGVDGEGRWLEPVQYIDGRAAWYIAKYISKDGGRVRTSKGMFLERYLKEEWLISQKINLGNPYPGDARFRKSDRGGFVYEPRLDSLDGMGTEWVGFDYDDAHMRGGMRPPSFRPIFTAVTVPSKSFGAARAVRVMVEDDESGEFRLLSAGERIPHAVFKLPRKLFNRGIPRDFELRFNRWKFTLASILQERGGGAAVGDLNRPNTAEDMRELYRVYSAAEKFFARSLRSLRGFPMPRLA